MIEEQKKEIIVVRGIAAGIQAMATPTFQALKELLAKFGWNLTREQTNKQS